MKNIVLPWILAFVSCQPQNQTLPEVARWQSQAENVTIIRDDFGVPHIYGKSDADAVFGLLYAQCEDDFNRVEQNYIWATGRLAEVEGEKALYSDLRAKLFMTEAEARENYAKSPDWLKATLRCIRRRGQLLPVYPSRSEAKTAHTFRTLDAHVFQ